MKYNFEGKKVEWSDDGVFNTYWTTNDFGDGVFLVNLTRNTRQLLAGTCDFSARGSKNAIRAKIRKFMREYYV